jgi:KaiC/GvpD/RAD55 family RecA-like ATPase
MSLGDTSKYVDILKRNITKNKYSSVGAIVGPYGYGKTSTAIHVWREMQERYNVLSIPPFEWLKLSDILEAVTAWVEYKFAQGPRQFIPYLRKTYEQYRDKSLEEVAANLGLNIDRAREAYEAGRINLGVTPAQVIAFLMDVCVLCTEAGFAGLVVFVDELQETADKYASIKDFQSDLFAFADKIPTHVGSLALIFTMPDTLEATINTTRPDIIHRLRQSSLYLRVEAIYGREFPRQLWEKYAEVFDFQSEKFAPITADTLDAIGQIAMRGDLGAGPRTVINAMVEAVKHYEVVLRPYGPLDLVNGFLEHKISFEEQGKFSQAVRKALENRLVASKPEYERTIKLLAAFPLGCSRETIKAHGLSVAFDQLSTSPIFGDVIYFRAEGYTLRALLEEEVPIEPTYVRLVRDDFVRSYAPDRAHARSAMQAFCKHVLEAVFQSGTKAQLDKWQWKGELPVAGKDARLYELEGSFSLQYPYRDVTITLLVSPQPTAPTWGQGHGNINFVFELNYGTDSDATSSVLFAPENHSPSEVVFQLNLMRKPSTTLNIPRLPDLYPPERMTPLFMLALLQYLDNIDDKIPAPEKTGELRIVKERLVQYATQGLLGNELEVDTRLGTQDVGHTLVRAVFQKMCTALYPHYTTLISSAQFQKHVEAYVKALRDPRVTPSVARGKEPLDTTKDYIARLFGQTRRQTVQTLVTQNLSTIAKLEWGKGRSEDAKIWFVMHPLEREILQLLRDSAHADQRSEGTIRLLPVLEVFEIGRKWGYRKEEIAEVIKLLSARQYATYNSDTNSIEQLIRSVDDLKESLIEGLTIIEVEIESLQVVTDFDPQRYQSRIEQIRTGAQQLEKAEDAEELNATLRSIEYGLRKYMAKTAEKLLAELRAEKSKVQPLLSAGVPNELTAAIAGGQAPWSGALEDTRQRLRKRYDELIGKYKKLAQDVEKSLSDLGPVEARPDYLVELVRTHATFHEQLEQLSNQRAAMSANQSNLRAWKKLLQRSNQVHQDAVTAKASFDEAKFLDAAEEIWHQIAKEFKDAPLDALSDHEIFFEDVAELERRIGDWQRKRREDFVAEKQGLENALRRVGDERPMLKTNFDPYVSPEESRESLRQEAVEHFQGILAQYEQQYQQLQNEVIYAERVQQVSGTLSADAVSISLAKVRELKKRITTQTLSDDTRLDNLTENITGLGDALSEMTSSVQTFITKRPLEGESENALLHIIQENTADSVRGVELRQVILQLVAGNLDFQLEQVMNDLQRLFKKNQVIIRIQPRR